MRPLAFRLRPGADLRTELEGIAREQPLRAGSVLTAVGSLARAVLRMPGPIGSPSTLRAVEGPLEIVSLVGTLGPDGAHLHIALSGPDGVCVGGHLMTGCIVHTTAELVIGEMDGQLFRRTEDAQTGFRELEIQPRGPRPRLIVLAGLPATGKSTIARELARRIGAVWLRIDSMDQAIWSSPTAPRDLEDWTYRASQAVAVDNLLLGRDVIADCVNDCVAARDGWRVAGDRSGAGVVWLQVVCGDPVEHRYRLETRPNDLPGLPPLDWVAVCSRTYDPWDRGGLTIDTARLSPAASVAAALAFLENETARDRSRAAPL